MNKGWTLNNRMLALGLILSFVTASCDSVMDKPEDAIVLELENYFAHSVGDVLEFTYSESDNNSSPPSYDEEGQLSIEFLSSRFEESIPIQNNSNTRIEGMVFSLKETRLGSRRTTVYEYRDGAYGLVTDTTEVADTLLYEIVRESDGFVHYNPSAGLTRYIDPFPTMLKSEGDEIQFTFGATGGGCYRGVTLDRTIGFKRLFNSCKFGLSRDTWFSISRVG